MALAADAGPETVAGDIRKRFAAIRRGKSFLNRPSQKKLAQELTEVIKLIETRIAPTAPGLAFDLLWAQLHLAEGIQERTDDSWGTIGDTMQIIERRFHTLYSLSAAVGIDRPRLSRLLRKLGEIPADATEVDCGNMVFEAATTIPMVEAFKAAVPLRDVPDYLGASKRQIEILYREGLVLPLVPRSGPGSVRHVVFGRSRLDELLVRIARLPEIAPSCDGDFHPISYACQRSADRFEFLFSEILEGRIPAFRNPDRTGIGSIVVDVGILLDAKTAA
ncbi:DUF6880 family protein [Pseudophaeobacter profundi]|uniref:DUF6880 family protein n=1 Tax=Pseudophaeobacter profundi TaxID=3034152 RepID=UPI0034D98652